MGEPGVPVWRRLAATLKTRPGVRSVLTAGAAAVFGVLLYGSTLSMEIVGGDLYPLLESSAIGSWTDVEQILTQRLMAGTGVEMPYYRPLASFSYSLGYAAFGLDPFGHHALNLAVFAGSILSVYAFSKTLTGSTSVAGGAAALFAMHPLFMEVAPLADHRMDLLVTLFGVLAFTLFVRAQQAGTPSLALHAGALSSYLAALASKEPALALVPLFVLYPLLTRGWELSWRRRITDSLRMGGPYVALGFAWLGVRALVLGGLGGRANGAVGMPWAGSLVEAVAAVSLKYIAGIFPPLVTASNLLGNGLYELGIVTALAGLAGGAVMLWGVTGWLGRDPRTWPTRFWKELGQHASVQHALFLAGWIGAGGALMVLSFGLGSRSAALFVPAACLLVAMGLARIDLTGPRRAGRRRLDGFALLALVVSISLVVLGPAGAGDLSPARERGAYNAAFLDAVDDALEAPSPGSHLEVRDHASARPDRGQAWPPTPLTVGPYKGATVTSWLHLKGTDEVASTEVVDDPSLDIREFSGAVLESSEDPIVVRLTYGDPAASQTR